MRRITKILLILNGLLLVFIVLWLLVGGGQRGYFRGGALPEVDGILLMLLGLFNLAFLLAVFLLLPGPNAARVQAAVQEAMSQDAVQAEKRFRSVMRTWSLWGLSINGALILFLALWLLVNSGRWNYFQANATEVDVILLLFLSVLNVAHMGLIFLRSSMAARALAKEPSQTQA
jgi:hypothetical protein